MDPNSPWGKVLTALLWAAAPTWDLPDDPFDIEPWLDVLSPEARDALEADR